MILIADSGSTKTDWRSIDTQGVLGQAKTSGCNPYFQSPENILQVLQEELINQINGKVETVYFYGAGCSSDENKQILEQSFRKVFPDAFLVVEHDLLGAARATCGHEPGIACILGTGSNSCVFDGKHIIDNIPSLGYVLGDEGSGACLGKRLIVKYLYDLLPDDLHDKFKKRYHTDREEVLDHVYRKPFPNRYLAQFTRFMFHHLKDPVIHQMVYEAFEDFFQKNVKRYPDFEQYQVNFAGSVAFYFSGILRQVANDQGITLKKILESPIAGLTLYHQEAL